MRAVSGILPLGGTILSTSSFDPFREPRGVERVKAAFDEDGFDAVVAIGGEHTMSITRRLYEERRPAARRRSEDDRQRRSLHRLHVRLRHRRADRERRDRPPAHHRPVTRPRDGDRGDGPQHRLDRRLQRHRRRRRRDRDPRAGADGGGDLRGDQRAPRARQGLLDRRRRGGRRAGVRLGREAPGAHLRGDRPVRLSAARRHRPSRWERRSSRAPASRHGSPRSATSSAAARRPPPTACWRRATA